jgi:uncharacterized protein YggE
MTAVEAAGLSGDAVPTVTVRGDAVLRVEPDEAVLWIMLTALKEAPGDALSDVSGRSETLITMLDQLGVDKRDRSTTGVSVAEEFDHTEQGRRSLGHRAFSRVSVRLSDSERIAQLLARATENLEARIEGPQWQISLNNPVRLEAARQAAAAARRKAEAFAEGVGAKLGELLELSEPGHQQMRIRQANAVGYSGGGVEPMPVEPGEQEVTASIQATFALDLD